MNIITLLYFAFVIYYLYTLYVFLNLQKNPCSCKKLETFKQSWNFKYVLVVTPLLLINNLHHIYKNFNKPQIGGTDLYTKVLFLLILGYGISFLNDYAIVDLFYTMKDQDCPCNVNNRKYLLNATYFKFLINFIIFVSVLITLKHVNFNTILKVIKKGKWGFLI